jgi:murein DD-endopeptidase MepM/ murein hydrolase activator NlpD
MKRGFCSFPMFLSSESITNTASTSLPGLILGLLLMVTACNPSNPSQNQSEAALSDSVRISDSTAQAAPTYSHDPFGFATDTLTVLDKKVRWSESMYTILRPYLSPREIYEITQQARPVFHPRELKVGQKYRLYLDEQPDGSKTFAGWVWQKDPINYVAIDWEDSLSVRSGERETLTFLKSASGVIHQSLYETVREQDLPIELMFGISDLFAWQIDFFTLQPGDRFSVVYEEKMIGDQQYMIGDIVAAEFVYDDERYTAFRYFKGEGKGYFDENGESVQKTLLKAPLHYSRISSGFSYNRMHPVLHRRMPHLGVDYAAPTGTPVVATGAGKVIEARYRGANGNIVKIRHNGTYTTTYIHLNGFAKGIHRGVRVDQGQTIGFVGSTGRATGPHLDYRVYKHNRPVNPTKLKLPPSESVPDSVMADFDAVKEGYLKLLYQQDPSFAQSKEESTKRDES